jgi:16S rRNA (guanine1207-N2)-methyltransferase
MSRRRDPDWRDAEAGQLVVRHLSRLDPSGTALVMEDGRDEVANGLAARGLTVERWWRRCLGGCAASAWPTAGPFDLTALRLPKAKDELEMAVHAAAAGLEAGGTLLVYGAKDEGIKSAGRRIEPLFGAVRTLATGGHCRVLTATRPSETPGLRGRLDEWRVEVALDLVELSGSWVSYPGVFAHGRLDAGTRMLLGAMPPLAPGARVLDFGCGSGILGAVLAARTSDARVDFLDVDAVALAAVAENVPGARTVLADGIADVGNEAYDAIISNPPYHEGKAETTRTVEAFVADAPRVLAPGGRLVLVVQRRLTLEAELRATFRTVRILDEDALYRIWEGVKG